MGIISRGHVWSNLGNKTWRESEKCCKKDIIVASASPDRQTPAQLQQRN